MTSPISIYFVGSDQRRLVPISVPSSLAVQGRQRFETKIWSGGCASGSEARGKVVCPFWIACATEKVNPSRWQPKPRSRAVFQNRYDRIGEPGASYGYQ
jgi:hypothetical protein